MPFHSLLTSITRSPPNHFVSISANFHSLHAVSLNMPFWHDAFLYSIDDRLEEINFKSGSLEDINEYGCKSMDPT
jgi:hypothetical protein